MGSIGIEGVLQRIAINAAAGISSIEQVTRLSVLNTSADSLGINQRAHYSIDQFASSTAVPYSTIRPAIFSASLLAAAREVRASRTWTGLAGSGRMALIDHRDAAEAGLRVLTDPALWGAHHDLTGPVPMSWPEALELLSAELGEPVTFRVAAERQFLERLIGAGVPAGTAELLIAREWAILAGENDYTTDTFQQITGRPRARWPSSSTSTARNSSDGHATFSPDPAPRLPEGLLAEEGKHVSRNIGVEERDLKGVFGDGTRLADELVEPLFDDHAVRHPHPHRSPAPFSALRRRAGRGIVPDVPGTAGPMTRLTSRARKR